MLISVDSTGSLPTAAADQALPPEVIPSGSAGGGTVYGSAPNAEPEATSSTEGEERSTAGNSAIMAAGSLVSRLIGFVRNMLIGMTLGAGVGDAYTSAQ